MKAPLLFCVVKIQAQTTRDKRVFLMEDEDEKIFYLK